MKKLQKMRSFWQEWKGWDFFGLQLPSLIALSLFIFLLIHMSFEICGIVGEAMRIKCVGHPTAMECGRDSLLSIALTVLKNTIVVVGSDTVRNLSLLLAASIGWFFFYWRAKSADQDAKTSEQGLTVERITRAIEQLAHEKPSVRLGGILGLEQVALSQKEEHEKIIRILVSFIRTRARKNSEEVKNDLKKSGLSKLKDIDDFEVYREQRLDVEDAIRVLSNIASKIEKSGQFKKQFNKSKNYLCNLEGTDLRGLKLVMLDLSNFNLKAVDFSGASLWHTNFSKATLSTGFIAVEGLPKFVEAYLFYAKFNDTNLSGINFTDSSLGGAEFNNASMSQSVLKNCNIYDVNLETSHGLTQEQIDKTYYYTDEHPPILPEGLKTPSPRKR